MALPLYIAHIARRPELWGVGGFQVVFVLGCLVISKRLKFPFRSGYVAFDGERLDFSGNSGGAWRLADVDSVIIQDHMIRIRVYRPGQMGNEFTAEADSMPPESWAELTELCRRIREKVNPGALPNSQDLEEVTS
ncbi:hypothetical protein [Haloferula sp. BvORR071]|uniref:hypothetical protein n=1 Tax=Haloferula sp. BvORR071 TaxID=1396141 RepID=UPI002240F379|nr:hypothetical protein [Haloferula sp. BvORR071]